MVEAPQFVHSEIEREQMRSRMQSLSDQDLTSGQELAEFCRLMIEHGLTAEYTDPIHDYEWEFPGKKPAVVITLPESADDEDDYFLIRFPDGLNKESGEQIYSNIDNRGRLRWVVGIKKSFYSEIVGRRFEIDHHEEGILDAEGYLTDSDHSILTKRLYQVFLDNLPAN